MLPTFIKQKKAENFLFRFKLQALRNVYAFTSLVITFLFYDCNHICK